MPKNFSKLPYKEKQEALSTLGALIQELAGHGAMDFFQKVGATTYPPLMKQIRRLPMMCLFEVFNLATFGRCSSERKRASLNRAQELVGRWREVVAATYNDNLRILAPELVKAQDEILYGEITRRELPTMYRRLRRKWKRMVKPIPTRLPRRVNPARVDAVVNGGAPLHGGEPRPASPTVMNHTLVSRVWEVPVDLTTETFTDS